MPLLLRLPSRKDNLQYLADHNGTWCCKAWHTKLCDDAHLVPENFPVPQPHTLFREIEACNYPAHAVPTHKVIPDCHSLYISLHFDICQLTEKNSPCASVYLHDNHLDIYLWHLRQSQKRGKCTIHV